MARKAEVVHEEEEPVQEFDETEDMLVDYDETAAAVEDETKEEEAAPVKGNYAGVHAAGFSDFFLKTELLDAIADCGFEHPSEVQQECLPNAMLGVDILCQAKSGMGKTAVFTLATLQNLPEYDGNVSVLVIAHTRELAYQIASEYNRFTKYLTNAHCVVVFGGVDRGRQVQLLATKRPNILVATPGRLRNLMDDGSVDLSHVKHLIVDECDSVLGDSMRADLTSIFVNTPRAKQVMMFTATLSEEMRTLAKQYLVSPQLVLVNDESRLTLHGLQQYYIGISEENRAQRLVAILEGLDYNQVVIFVARKRSADQLSALLKEHRFDTVAVSSIKTQEERLMTYQDVKTFRARIVISTDVFGRGVDFERVNIVVNYDMPRDADTYLHRAGRAGRFGTKGLAISMVTTEEDKAVLAKVQERFEVKVEPMPEVINRNDYLA